MNITANEGHNKFSEMRKKANLHPSCNFNV